MTQIFYLVENTKKCILCISNYKEGVLVTVIRAVDILTSATVVWRSPTTQTLQAANSPKVLSHRQTSQTLQWQ